MDEEQRYANGMAVRRAVLGDQHVDRAQANVNDFSAEFQNLTKKERLAVKALIKIHKLLRP
jgi:FixJ family two-component response regulator